MAQLFLSTLVLVLVSIASQIEHGRAVALRPTSSNFKFIGSIKEDCEDCPETHYFLSQNAASWVGGERDCKKTFGKDATLVYIGDEEEFTILTEFIEDSDDTGAIFFTGGMYSVAKGEFMWKDKTTINVGAEWFSWLDGHKPTKTDASKIVAVRVAGVGIQFKTVLQTESQRYICEFKG